MPLEVTAVWCTLKNYLKFPSRVFIWSLLFSYNNDKQNNIIKGKCFVDTQTDFEPTVTACYQPDKNDLTCFSLPKIHERKSDQGKY